jgi:hypothetical protein
MKWKATIKVELGNSLRSSKEAPEQIARQFEEILQNLKDIGAALDEQVLTGARAGMRHLVDGMNSDVPAIRKDEFLMARREFARLASLIQQEAL